MLREILQSLSDRVAHLERGSDLAPPLGVPGGVDFTTSRIEQAIKNENLEKELIEQVENGLSISNQNARKVYRFDDCNTIQEQLSIFKGFCVSSHGQFLMDQRGITVKKLRGFFFNLEKYIERNQTNRNAQDLIYAVERGKEAKWTDPYSKNLTVVFRLQGDSAKIITAYYKNKKDPKKSRRILLLLSTKEKKKKTLTHKTYKSYLLHLTK